MSVSYYRYLKKLKNNKPTFYFNQHIIPKNYLIE